MDTDALENVTVTVHLSIKVGKGYEDVKLVDIDRRETGKFTLMEAAEYMRAAVDAAMTRLGSRMEDRIVDARRQITAE